MSLDEAEPPFWAIADSNRRRQQQDPPRDAGTPVSGAAPAVPPTGDSGAVTMGRTKISHIARDSRMPSWRRRIIIAVVVGVAVTVWLNWRIGLTVAVLAGIADAVITARSTASSSAAGITTGAQRQTKKQLSQMERSGFRALHMRSIPGSTEVIDHLLVGPTGVYAIDSEEWDKRLPVRTKNARQLWHGPFSQKDRLEHARWEAAQASELVGNALGERIEVRPAMAVYGPAIPWGVATIRDVDVFSGGNLRKYLRKRPFGGRVTTQHLAAPEIERIYAAAERVLPPTR
ncbi:MAG TPA: nuclease-related domain-containing protein [Streptosporangiaceae bacterium]